MASTFTLTNLLTSSQAQLKPQSKSRLTAPAIPRSSVSFTRRRRSAVSALSSGSPSGGQRRYKGTVRREEALTEMIEKKVAEAIEACEGGQGSKYSEGYRVAWDEVEEISQAKADFRRRIAESGGADPLESFCEGNPESDECVIYDDHE
ncbi:hypothetical protein LUZ60_003403 [Juncus effusus]|nr:hypothetical protein LUZ60_003403 [Juncus effusus]